MKSMLNKLTVVNTQLKRSGARAKAFSGIIACMMMVMGSVQASVIIKPSFNVTGGTVQAGAISYVTDGSGLSFALNDGDPVPETLPTHAGGAGAYPSSMVRWFNWLMPTEFIFDLGSSFAQVDDLILYNYQEGSFILRGIASVTATYSSDGVNYSGAETLNFAATSGLDPFAGQVISINKADIRYVKFTNIVNLGDAALTGLAEVRFTATIPIPTWDGIASGDAEWTNPDSTSWSGMTYTNGDNVAFFGAGTGTVTIAGAITPGSITVSNQLGDDYTISGTISGTGAITKDGDGDLILNGSANAYTFSSITIDGGELEVAGKEYAGIVNIDNGATYRDETGSTWCPTLNFGPNGGGTVAVGAGNHLRIAKTVTTSGGTENFISGGSWNAIGADWGVIYTFNVADGTDASDLTVSTFCWNWPLIEKTGNGTLTLTASNNYIAPPEISQGTLLYNGSMIAAPANSTFYGDPVKVKGGTTLGGTGTIPYFVNVWGNGTLAAGDVNSIGTLTLNAGLQFTASPPSTNVVRVTGSGTAQQNKVVVTGGDITLNSATLVIDDTGLSNMSSQPLTIIDNGTDSAISGIFGGLAEGAEVLGMNGSKWTISYVGGTGNDVVLTAPAQGTVILVQ